MTALQAPAAPLSLGVDTGGTFTDAVLYAEGRGVVAKAKALTTRHDLAVGIAGAVDAVLAEAGVPAAAIGLVSMSTTLATNALVEGVGGRVALVMIGFGEADLARDGLGAALGGDPVVFLPGGHDVYGNETPLDLAPLEAALPDLAGAVSAFAVCAYFAVRNPAHENAARGLIRRATGLPATASHELSSQLGGPRRALTTLLNARLVGLVDRLVAATEGFLAARGIAAPLMMVRGDGALVSAAFARRRPIETILSGPAASLVGARHLTGLDAALVSDIGGTTTDVAMLDGGRPRLDPEGATVGGHRTMVEAVAMRTFGLGGDSEVALETAGLVRGLLLGPRRLVPLALVGHQHGAAVRETLERQARAAMPTRLDGRFALRTGVSERLSSGLTPAEARLYALLGDAPVPLDRLLDGGARPATLDRLVARGLAQIAGFTPTDAAHVLGLQTTWDAAAARLGATLFARRRDARGLAVADDAAAISRRVLDALQRRSAEALVETAFAEDGLDPRHAGHPLVARALDGRAGVARLALALDRPVVGLGASAALHYRGLGARLGTDCVLPPDADVANALGAVVGRVSIRREARVVEPQEGRFRASAGAAVADFSDENAALDWAESELSRQVADEARAAGGEALEVAVDRDVRAVTVEGSRRFVEAVIGATASGRPRFAVAAGALDRSAN